MTRIMVGILIGWVTFAPLMVLISWLLMKYGPAPKESDFDPLDILTRGKLG